MRFLVAATIVFASCYDASVPSGLYKCGPSGACPSGLLCVNGCCVVNASDTCGAIGGQDGGHSDGPSVGNDMATLDTTGGCADPAGRAGNDPQWGNIAFCNAYWAVGGITSGRPCGAFPGTQGRHNGADCAITDNCATGWHVCANADLSSLGHNYDQCLHVPGGFWVSSTTDSRTSAQCGGGDTLVWGCGNQFMTSIHACSVLSASMDVTDCAMTTGGANPYNCGVQIGVTLTKTGPGGGGVMCCKG